MDWVLNLTANGFEDLETQLPDLIAAVVHAGAWIMDSDISADGGVHTRFEFEREVCAEIYTSLIAAGLELNQDSHVQLAQLCHCNKGRETAIHMHLFAPAGHEKIKGPGTAMIDLRILPFQVDGFDHGQNFSFSGAVPDPQS